MTLKLLSMSELRSDGHDSQGGMQYSGLVKLMSAKKKVEVILSRSTRSTDSAVFPAALASSTDSAPQLETAYTLECKRANVTAQRSVKSVLSLASSELNFSACQLGANGSLPLMRCLGMTPDLRALILRSCGLTDRAVIALADSLKATRLSSLDISDNPEIGFVGGFAIERMVSLSSSLSHVNVDGTGIREATKRRIEALCTQGKDKCVPKGE